MKYVRVSIENGTSEPAIVEYHEINDTASEEEIEVIASDAFFQHCDYGYSVVDELP